MYEAARCNLLHNVSKNKQLNSEVKSNKLFVEEGATKYFRRLAFSPDGAFLLVPGQYSMYKEGSCPWQLIQGVNPHFLIVITIIFTAGQVPTTDDVQNVTFLFARSNLKT